MKNKFQNGLTLLELMVVIAVIGIIATAFVATARVTYAQKLEDRAENFTRDVKYVRNLATSRAAYQFSGQSSAKYPDGGYGIVVKSTAGDYYDIVAYKADGTTYEVIKHVPFESDIDLRVDVTSPAQYNFYMRFTDEKNMVSDMTIRSDNKYAIKMGKFTCTGTCDRAITVIAEKTADTSLVYNTAYTMLKEVISQNPPVGGSCFVAGTKIMMADGSLKNIEDVTAGDAVLGKHGNTSISATVHAIESPTRDGYYIIRLADNQRLSLTDEHPVYSRGDGWEDGSAIQPLATWSDAKMKVRSLEAGNQVYTLSGWQKVQAIDYIPGKIKTYNLSDVEGNVFFADGVMVHNKKPPSQQLPGF